MWQSGLVGKRWLVSMWAGPQRGALFFVTHLSGLENVRQCQENFGYFGDPIGETIIAIFRRKFLCKVAGNILWSANWNPWNVSIWRIFRLGFTGNFFLTFVVRKEPFLRPFQLFFVPSVSHPFLISLLVSYNALYFPNTATFKQVAQTVAGVNLRDHLIDVVFKLFDENGKFVAY